MSERRALSLLALAMSAGVAAGIVVLWINGVAQRDDKEAAQSELTGLAEQVQAACLGDPATARKILGADACGKSKEIVERPPAEKGDPGATGARGPAGPTGPAGPRGPAGPAGPPGAAGRTPPCVLQLGGCDGRDGKDGAAGQDGPTGPAGPAGADGVAGKDGAPGADGQDGEPGKDGAPGKDGPPGPPGPAGPSCEPGSTLQKQQVITTETPTGTWILACVLDDQNP